MISTKERYNQRIHNLKQASNHEEPDNIPIYSMWATWPTALAGEKTEELFYDYERLLKVWSHAFETVYTDCALNLGTAGALPVLQRLGSTAYFISEDGVTLQHKQNCAMTSEDYPAMIEDPMALMVDVLSKRKFPALNGSDEEIYQTLKDCAIEYINIAEANGKLSKLASDQYGIVQLHRGVRAHPPLDVLFDRVRGFNGTLTDLRRHGDQVLEATQALYPIYEAFLQKGLKNMGDQFSFANTMVHSPTFIGQKYFEKYFWPTYKPLLMQIAEANAKIIMFLEGDWSHLLQYLRDVPKSTVLAVLEATDLFQAKKEIGDHISLMGGVPTSILRYSSKQECLDYAKRVLDECAPGGGFLFGTERVLMTENDVNTENMVAVNEYVRVHGAK